MKIEKSSYCELYEFKDIEDSLKYIYYKISFENRIFGYLIFEKSEDLILRKIYIKERFRNSGYGSKLLNYAIYDSADIIGVEKIVVEEYKNLNNFLEKNDFFNINGKYVRKGFEDEINNLKVTIKVSKISIFINILLAFFKLFLGYTFKINSLIADGINSFSDLINNILILVGASIGKEPYDEDHPFGHGKIETVFSLIIGVIIVISSLNVMKNSIISLVNKHYFIISEKYNLILGISIIMIILKILQYIYVYVYSKKYTNSLIKSLLLDYNFDIILSSTVFIGLLGAKFLDPSLDSILSILITIYLIKQGYENIKENTLMLMDSQDENLLLKVKLLTLEIEEIKNIHDIYMTRVGNNVYIIADIRLDENLTLREAHKISERAERHVKFRCSNIKKVIYHIEPIYSEE